MESLLDTIKKVGIARLSTIGAATLISLSLLVMFYNRVSTPDMKLIYGGLELQDASKIVSKLEMLDVPFEVRGDGSQIYVSADQAARARMAIAESGLVNGNVLGYEILDKTDNLGTTSFLQDINHIRALEGELTKSIKTINGVMMARVHLVIPKKELFAKVASEPSASIVLKMGTIQRLNSGQIKAIQHLVSAAVAGLVPHRISIIDDQGTLLARGSEKEDGGADADEQKISTESRYSKMIESLLEKSLGVGKVRTEVNIDMEYDRVTENSEIFDPSGQVARSIQTVEEGNNASEKNSDGSVSVQNALPTAQGQQGNDAKNSQQSKRNEETVNYEISKTIRTQVREGGKIKRISVAVLVDGTYKKENDKDVYVPREKQEIDQITSLVKSSIGFKADRGDTVEIINMRFIENVDAFAGDRTDTILGFEKHQFVRLLEILILGILGIVGMMTIIKPLLAMGFTRSEDALSAPEAQNLLEQKIPTLTSHNQNSETFASSEDQNPNITNIDSKTKRTNVQKIEELVDQNPTETVNIVRSWMNTSG